MGPNTVCGSPPRASDGGFTFVSMLVLLVVLMLGAGAAGPLWAHQVKREREQELFRVGAAYARAIASYRTASPGSLKQYPTELMQLTRDLRFVATVRHLRQLYPDPITPSAPWALIKDAQGQIIGVSSQSSDEPLAAGPIDLGDIVLPAARRYSDWKFIASTPAGSRPQP